MIQSMEKEKNEKLSQHLFFDLVDFSNKLMPNVSSLDGIRKHYAY